ncbi:MAG: S24/S26 family peptidase [Actinomycetota bacterium]
MGDVVGAPQVEARSEVLRRRARQHGLTLPTTGTSMLPHLPAGRTVTVDPDRPVRFGDVVAFVDDHGNVVVHRLVRRTDGRLRCLGDNRRTFDPPVPDSRLVGHVDEPRRVLGHGVHTMTTALRTLARKARRRLPGTRR